MPDSSSIPLLLPKLGHSMEAATILTWHAAEGDRVAAGQVIVSIETDKATYDLESPGTGTLHIAVPEGEEVPVDTVIANVGGAVAAPDAGTPAPSPTPAPARAAAAPAPARAGKVLASPKARQLAAELGVDLATVTASAADGVVSAADVTAAAAHHETAPAAPAQAGKVLASPKARQLAVEPGVDLATVTASAADGVISTADVSRTAESRGARPAAVPAGGARREVSREKLAGIRRTAARRLQESWQTIPHIVQVVDADATGLLAERAHLKAAGMDASVNDLILHAAARAVASVPALNVTLDGEEVVRYEGVDIGMAVESPRGLVVPVIRGAGSLSLAELAAAARRLAAAARDSRLGPDDFGGASLTVSNLGMHGIRMGSPVINLGEPALLFVGAIESRPAVVDGALAVRPMVTLSVAFDHRLADGVLAASLTRALKAEIEAFAPGEAAPAPPAAASLAPVGEKLAPREIRSASRGDSYRVDVRSARHAWPLDEPAAEGGTGEGPSPVEAFLGALLGCMTVSFKAAARRRKVPITRIEGSVIANPQRYLTNITLRLQVVSPATEAEVADLLPAAKKGCFVGGVIRDDVQYTVELRVTPD